MNELPAPDRLQKAWEELREIHEEYLAVHDVTIPRVERYNERQKAMWLAMLFLNRHREVHKDEMSALARRDMPKLGADQQVRHLKRDGWALSGERGRHRLDPFAPSPEFVRQSARKRSRLSAEDFERLKRAFGGRCATCGAREGRPDPRYGGNPVVLQPGHKNPADAGDDPDNILPQCQFCNQGYKDDFVFDDRGRVRAIAGVGPVRRARRDVQRKVYGWLKKRFSDAPIADTMPSDDPGSGGRRRS